MTLKAFSDTVSSSSRSDSVRNQYLSFLELCLTREQSCEISTFTRLHTKNVVFSDGQSDEEDITHVAQKDPSSYSSSFQPVIYKDAFNFFPHLPPELILYIFNYLLLHDLAQAAQVSRLWRAAVYDSSLYRVVDFYPYRRTVDDMAVHNLLLRATKLERLNLTYCLHVERMDLLMEVGVARCAASLTELDVTDCTQFTDEALLALCGCQLRSLILVGTKITSKGLLRWAETAANPTMELLNVSSIKGIREKDIAILKHYLPNTLIIWRVGGNKVLFCMEPFPYSCLPALPSSKLSCKTGLRIRSFYRYITLKLNLDDETRHAEDIIEIVYQNQVLPPTATLDEAVGVWPHDKNVIMRYRKRGESEIHTIRPANEMISRSLRRKTVPVVEMKGKDVKEKRPKEGCIMM